MRGELLYVQHPHRVHLKWLIFYTVLVVGSVIGMYTVAAHVRTHTLPVGQLELDIPYTRYVVGEEITFTLKNDFNGVVFVTNNCPAEPLMVYKQQGTSWVRIHDQASPGDCPTEARQIGVSPNGVVTGSFAKWKNLFSSPGKYRVVAYVEYYNSLPYDDFEVVTKSTARKTPKVSSSASSKPVLNAKYLAQQKTSSGSITSSQGTSSTSGGTGSTGGTTTGGGTTTANPQTYTVSVNSSGVYNVTSLSLKAGDSIKFVYTAPRGDEVRTRFTPQAGTATSVSSVTVDSEHTTGTRTFTAAGTWSFRADDHSGNTGIVTVK